jgi:ABC-type branched-subunit amino acid transport system ATPase component
MGGRTLAGVTSEVRASARPGAVAPTPIVTWPAAPVGTTVARTNLAPVLEATDVSVRFGGVAALSGVSLTLPADSIVGLVGPNGAGKTTLFGVLSGLLPDSSGGVKLAGEDVTRTGPRYRASLGLARTFQHPQLFGELTVREHLVLADRVRHARRRLWTDLLGAPGSWTSNPGEASRIDSLLALFGLESVAGRVVDGLPLGVCRLVEVAQALATKPKALLLDEPSAGLDSRESQRLGAVLARIPNEYGVAVLLVEHDFEMVLQLSESVYVLDFGKLIAHGSPDEIRKDAGVRAAYLGQVGHVADAE